MVRARLPDELGRVTAADIPIVELRRDRRGLLVEEESDRFEVEDDVLNRLLSSSRELICWREPRFSASALRM